MIIFEENITNINIYLVDKTCKFVFATLLKYPKTSDCCQIGVASNRAKPPPLVIIPPDSLELADSIRLYSGP